MGGCWNADQQQNLQLAIDAIERIDLRSSSSGRAKQVRFSAEDEDDDDNDDWRSTTPPLPPAPAPAALARPKALTELKVVDELGESAIRHALHSPLRFELPSTPELRKRCAQSVAAYDRLRQMQKTARMVAERRRDFAGIEAILESPSQLGFSATRENIWS